MYVQRPSCTQRLRYTRHAIVLLVLSVEQLAPFRKSLDVLIEFPRISYTGDLMPTSTYRR